MTDPQRIEESASKYVVAAGSSASTLFEKELYGQFLIIVYSSIDAMGLLCSPPGQTRATRPTFKAWSEQFLIPRLQEPLTSTDLYSARCAVLHTYTTQSDLSRSGEARQIHYYQGSIASEELAKFVLYTNRLDNGAHIAVHLGNFGTAFIGALSASLPALIDHCISNPQAAKRLQDVMQVFPAAAP